MKKPSSFAFDRMYSDEADLLEKVVSYYEPQRRDGIKLMKVRDRYAKGYSDVFFCVRGTLVVAELKDDIGVASTHQLEFIDEIIACGGIGGVCRTLGEVKALIDEALRRQPVWPI